MSSIKEVLEFAIEQEQGAYQFYMELAKNSKRMEMKQAFLDFADEEKGHKKKLEGVLNGKITLATNPNKPVLDLKIADYTVDAVINENMDYQEALLFAMKKEKAAFMLYTHLASAVSEPEIKNTFLALAQEEAKHKLRFEIEYDEQVLREN